MVSVIMPAFNADTFISEAISSVLAQTYTDWELIIIDDGSTDDTARIVKNFTVDPRIRYFYQTNGKQGKARNLGIREAQGAYIAFLDADDLWSPQKLGSQLAVLSVNEDIDVLFCGGYFLKGEHQDDYDVKVKDRWDIADLELMMHYNQIPILSSVVRSQALRSVDGFSEEPEIQNAEDHHLWLKLFIEGFKFSSGPERLFYYRSHGQQSTRTSNPVSEAMFHVYKDIFYRYGTSTVRRAVLLRISWYLFGTGHCGDIAAMAAEYLNGPGMTVKALLVRSLFRLPGQLPKKIVFSLFRRNLL